ncbi:MAG TPA: hypothetical protein PLO23_05525 [Alphaproteobacteria bacterium]|nr:hypothetical protein [Alphaproteobacteria bacterium]
MPERIIGASILGAFLVTAAAVATDQIVYKPQAKELAAGLAAKSMVAGTPDAQAKLASDLVDYRGQSAFLFMEHRQNARDFKTATDFGLTFWRLENTEKKSTVDLETSKGRRMFDVAKDFLSAKVIDTTAIIDNRDPARGPVFIHDGLEQSQFDATMDFLKAQYGTAANMPQALIAVTYRKNNVGIFVDEDGKELSKSPYAPYIAASPWNPKLAHEGIAEKGRSLIKKGLDFLDPSAE